MGPRVMIVEDERIVAFDMQQRLTSLGYDVSAVATTCEEALRAFRNRQPDCVLMDIRIAGDKDGIETAEQLSSISPVPVVYVTAHSEDSTLDRARKSRPYGYLLKPFTERELHATIQMAIERHKFEATLQRSEQRLRLALEAAQLGIVDIDTETFMVDLGSRSAEILGIDTTMARATCATLLEAVDEEDRERVRAEVRRCIDEPQPCTFEFRRTAPDGHHAWIRAQGHRVVGRNPRLRLVGVVQDITERKHSEAHVLELNEELERTIRSRTAELHASLEELRAFSYSVAHDLRAPLRAVLGFSERLKEDFRSQMDDECYDYVDRVHAAGQRMSEVIDALLALARLTRVEIRRETIDLSEMAHSQTRVLKQENPDRAVETTIEPGMMVEADPSFMRVVIENLLRNAWKFTSKHAQAHIEVGSEDTPAGKAYFVRDDGVGFSDTRTEQLFLPFRRLHLARDFEGLGIGLATVQRIVQRHGGTIGAEGAPEKGAKFSFTVQPPPGKDAPG